MAGKTGNEEREGRNVLGEITKSEKQNKGFVPQYDEFGVYHSEAPRADDDHVIFGGDHL